MFGIKKYTGKTTKVSPESEDGELPRELTLSASMVSAAPNSMQQVQGSADSLQNVVVTEQNENCEPSGDGSSTRKRPSFDPVEVKVQIIAGEAGEVESASTSLSGLRLADGEKTHHVHSKCLARPVEAIGESIKSVGCTECAITSKHENLETGHVHVQLFVTADYCREKQCVSKQGALEDAMQTSRCTVSSSADEFQSQRSVFSKSSFDGSTNMDKVTADATVVTIPRTNSTVSTEGYGDCCRICQQQTDEALVEIGCECRGDLAKAHLSCMELWFTTRGSNKCEICQRVASNVPVPVSQPLQHFWVWRTNGPYGGFNLWQRRPQGVRFHPLWAALLILIAGLLFDILISIFLGASALPVNIIIGVLVILGLGTAVRLFVECWHERNIRRTLRGMEADVNLQFRQERPPTPV